jgi:gamma-glutamylcyclotransferase (GGCT)/AIG2-like uncharacterized protein YtfP
MSKLLKVFVYGTLKVGGKFAKNFDDVRVSVKPGTIKGTLFNIHKSFPGLVLEGDTEIAGEVHEYTNAKAVGRSLDRIEGYGGPDNKDNLYDKADIEVKTAEGTEICKVYVFAKETGNFDVITNGEWEL